MNIQQAIASIAQDPDASDTSEKIRLVLGALWNGAPVEHVRVLLESADNRVLLIGSEISSEIGPTARPLLKSLVKLLSHEDPQVRLDVLDAILDCTDSSDVEVLAKSIMLVDDNSSQVRWKSMECLAQLTPEELLSVVPQITSGVLQEPMQWLGSPKSADPAQIRARLRSSDAPTRRIAAVAASRLSPPDKALLSDVASGGDDDIHRLGANALAALTSGETGGA